MESIAPLSAAEIIDRIAWSNNISSEEMRRQIEVFIQSGLKDPSSTLFSLRQRLFSETTPSMDEMIIAFQQELYDKLVRHFEGWVWIGDGYLNTSFCSLEKWNALVENSNDKV